ncbi:MAG: 16S rRNA (cytidine(1402)-2'-O)-methyltransferase [Saprospiraceae bacterium]|nr:16S rRNA (cytidine(1402)-2'-O)-methyltransferase [Saprospiraceae bacterium]
MTFRAVSVLKDCDLIMAEDTRTSSKLLKHFEIETPLTAYHAFNEHKILNHILEKLHSGQNIALISDAGTPGISDPGFLVVRECVKAGIKVTCLPGPTALVPALVSSGMSMDKFFFEGFLPHKKGRQSRWQYLAELPCTFILYESPHRVEKCLKEIAQFCGEERQVCIAREISKMYEEIITLPAKEWLNILQEKNLKGEMVIVVQGKHKNRNSDTI